MARVPSPEQRDPAGGHQPLPVPRMRFRWELLVVPLLLLLGLVLYEHVVDVVPQWTDVLETLRVRHRERYTNLAVLATGLVALLAIINVLAVTRR